MKTAVRCQRNNHQTSKHTTTPIPTSTILLPLTKNSPACISSTDSKTPVHALSHPPKSLPTSHWTPFARSCAHRQHTHARNRLAWAPPRALKERCVAWALASWWWMDWWWGSGLKVIGDAQPLRPTLEVIVSELTCHQCRIVFVSWMIYIYICMYEVFYIDVHGSHA